MKYSNSLKYINSFERAPSIGDISAKRVRLLCDLLGRINIKNRYLTFPGGSAGYASSVMMENIIKTAGYNVGRISSEFDFDSRNSVYIGGDVPSIDYYNKAVAEIKSVVIKMNDQTFYREEIVFALSLLICKMYGCEYVILQGMSSEQYSLDAICAPYDLVFIPTVYEESSIEGKVNLQCEYIKRGVREVIIGNQRSEIYNMISSACARSGVRLSITSKTQFEVNALSVRNLEFSYAGREGYSMKNPSHLLRDCAMLVIEGALAIRRDGIKMPWSSITSGIQTANELYVCDVVSVSPFMVVDGARSNEEIGLLFDTLSEAIGDIGSLSLCVKCNCADELEGMISALDGKVIKKVIVYCDDDSANIEVNTSNYRLCEQIKDAAESVHAEYRAGSSVLCVGSVDFAREIKKEFIRLMGY